jgi:hypothetical protein
MGVSLPGGGYLDAAVTVQRDDIFHTAALWGFADKFKLGDIPVIVPINGADMGMAQAGFEIDNALPEGGHDPVAGIRKFQVQGGNVRHSEVRQVSQGTAPRIEQPPQMIPDAQIQVFLRRPEVTSGVVGKVGRQYV